MKSILFASFLALNLAARADLVITEVMAASQHPAQTSPTPDADGDWWELTNTGTSAVSLTGYSWDDTPTPATPTISYFPPGVNIDPGESIIILQEPAANVSTWRAAWGVGVSTQVINRDQFASMGGEGFSNLSSQADEVNLYNASGDLVAGVSFGASTAGKSKSFLRDGTPIYGEDSVAGKHGAYSSSLSPSDVGSPGDAGVHFTSVPVAHAHSIYTYWITAENPSSSTPVISASSLPSFLTLTPGTDGTAVLSNNRDFTLADAGTYLIQITATSGAKSTVQEFVLTVFNPLAPIILNEYNAVASTNYLNGGTLATDDDGGDASVDSYFGRVLGNGGQWVEFVVVGDGGSTPVDMRGWSVEIGTSTNSGFVVRNKLVLSSHTDWQAVPVGTILTFIDKKTSQGGADSGFALRDRRGTVGDVWTNIWMGDSTYLTYSSLATNGYSISAGVVSGIVIDNDATQFRVKNNSGQILFGPAGEGIAPLSGTNSKEVFELEGNPTPSVSPLVASSATGFGYDDGASESTFGYPNNWLDGTTPRTQRFTSLTTPEIVVEEPVGHDVADGGARELGSVNVGESADITFTILNIGSADLTGLATSIDGSEAADFQVTTSPVAPVTFGGAGTTLTVTFTPSAVGVRTAVLHVVSNEDDESPFDITLTGTGVVPAPEIVVQQPAGSVLVDGSSVRSLGSSNVGVGVTRTFAIYNTGTADLTGLAVTVTGANATEFIVTAQPAATVTAGGATTFAVTFKPTSAGAKAAAIHIANNDADEAPFDVTLTGTGVLPLPEITIQQPKGSNLTDNKSKKSFGTVKLGKTGSAKTFVIKNLGTANLTGLAITKNGKNAKDFIVTSPVKKSLAPGASTTFKVKFKPTAKGTRNAAIHVKSNDANESPFDIKLTGKGA